MKKLWMLIAVTAIAFSLSAQRGVRQYQGGIVKGPRVVTIVRPGFGAFHPGFGYGFAPFGYAPFGYQPFGYRGYGWGPGFNQPATTPRQPLPIDLTIAEIKNDYGFEIASVRNNKSIDRQERKQKIRDLKHQRDDAIISAKREYYKEKR